MRLLGGLFSIVLVSMLCSMPAEAAKKKKRTRIHDVGEVLDPTREVVYVRHDLLKLFWSDRAEPALQPYVRGLTPYAGLNAWIAQRVALGYFPYELPAHAKDKYCNYWIEEQSYDVSKRLYRISPEGWCYPAKKRESK